VVGRPASRAADSDAQPARGQDRDAPRPGLSPDDSQPRGKRRAPAAELNISQLWYDEGDQLSGDDDAATRTARAHKTISPSTTDLSYYDEPPRRRWGLIAGLGAFAVVGSVMAFALTRGGSPAAPAQLAQREPPSQAAVIDAGPSTILPSEPPASRSRRPRAPPDRGPSQLPRPPDRRPRTARDRPHPPRPRSRPGRPRGAPHRRDARRRDPRTGGGAPGLGAELPGARVRADAPRTGAGPTSAADSGRRPSAPTVTDIPKDPYGDDTPADGAAPDRKAEFFANLGGSS